MTNAETIARRFHEAYERLAPSFGYETRAETRNFDPASDNGRLMIAVCAELSGSLAPATRSSAGMAQWLSGELCCARNAWHGTHEMAWLEDAGPHQDDFIGSWIANALAAIPVAQTAPVVTDEMVERDQDLIGRLLAEAKVWPRSDISGLLREAANALTAGLTPRDDAGEW